MVRTDVQYDVLAVFLHKLINPQQQVSVFVGCGNPLVMAKRPLIKRSSLLYPLQGLANGTLSDTRKPSNINLSVPFTTEPNNELQDFTWNMAWHFLNIAVYRLEGRFNQWDSRESYPIAPSADPLPWLLMILLIQSCLECICSTIPYRKPFKQLP